MPRKRGGNRSILPLVQSQPKVRQIFRFRATSALVSVIYVRDVLNLYHVATTAVVSYGVIGAFRIRRVKMFTIAEGGSGTEFNTIALTFQGGLYGRNQEFTAAGSSAMPGVISQTPPKDSSAAFWHSVPLTGAISGNGEPLLFINSQTTGVIVDLDIEFTLCDGSGLMGAALTVVAATAGVFYTNNLDNSTSSGGVGNNNLIPVGRTSLQGVG